jgi:hypothetical protein
MLLGYHNSLNKMVLRALGLLGSLTRGSVECLVTLERSFTLP